MNQTLVAAIGAATLASTALPGPTTPAPRSATVPFAMRESLGNPRVVVHARINGHDMPMMVHSAALGYAQLKHGHAASFGVPLLPGSHRSYGIDRDGHVSDLGQDAGMVSSLTVGRSVSRDVRVSIFEVPQRRLDILGVGWIRANAVVVDFARRRIDVMPTAMAEKERRERLLRRGYVALPMRIEDDGGYVVDATVNGVTRRMHVGTSSSLSFDTAFADAAHLRRGPDNGFGNGPKGAQVPNFFLAAPVRVSLGHWTSPPLQVGYIQDDYLYSSEPRPREAAPAYGGTLGGSFLVKTGAVVDFGMRTLYVRAGASDLSSN